jgi:hypothetical protein
MNHASGTVAPVVEVVHVGDAIVGVRTAGLAAPRKPGPARIATETVRVGRVTEVFDASVLADPAQARLVEGFRTTVILWAGSREDFKLASPVTACVTGAGLRDLDDALTSATPARIVPSGTDRLFKTTSP